MSKRKEYQKRFNIPLFTTAQKTTTPEGKKEYQRQYMKQYMRKVRELQR
jgi:hypothetical protein